MKTRFYKAILFLTLFCFTVAVLPVVSIPALSAPVTASTDETVTDVIVGKNNAGPYNLTWKNIDDKSISVVVTGKTLKKDEYSISAADGILSFSSTLVEGSIARVTYKLISGKSVKGGTSEVKPLSLSLMNKDNSSLNVSGLFAQDANGQGKTVIGIGGEQKWGGSVLSSSFHMSQDLDSKTDADTMDRAAMSFGTDTNIGSLKISGNYSQVGNSFAGSNEYGLALGQKLTDLNMAFAPTNGPLQMNAKYYELEETTGDKKGLYSLVSEQNMVFAPTETTKLAVNRVETANRAAKSSTTESVDRTDVNFEQLFGATQAKFNMTDSFTVDAKGNKTDLQSKDYSVATAISNIAKANLSMTDRLTTVNGSLTDIQSKDYALQLGNENSMRAAIGMIDRQTTKDGVLTDLQEKNYNFVGGLNPSIGMTFGMLDKQVTENGILTDHQEKNYGVQGKLSDNMTAILGMTDKQVTKDGVLYDYQVKTMGLSGNLAGGLGFRATSTDIFKSDAGVEDNIRANALELSKALSNKINFSSMISRQTSDLRGEDNALVFSVDSKLRDNLSLGFSHGTYESDVDGNTTSQGIHLDVTPTKQLAVKGSFADKVNEKSGKTFESEFDVTANPINNMSVTAHYKGAQTEKDGLNETTGITLKANPMNNLEIVGTVADKTEKSVETLSRNLSLTTNPTKFAKVTALLGQSGKNGSDTVTTGAALALNPMEKLALTAGFTQATTGEDVLTISDYSTSIDIWKGFSVNGNYRDRNATSRDEYDTMNMKVAFSPLGFLSITGDYYLNPEDSKGAIQHYEASTVGLTTKIGSLSFTGAYTSKDEYLASKFVDEQKLGMSMPVFGSGSLSTGYTVARNFATNDDLSKMYSLAYKQQFSDNFSLSLGGSYTKYIQNQMYMPDRDEYKAEATLDLKF